MPPCSTPSSLGQINLGQTLENSNNNRPTYGRLLEFTVHMAHVSICACCNFVRTAKICALGQRAPNPSVVTLDGTSHPHLLNFCRGNRPLVLNFGSWSCPVFRARTQEFLSIVRQFRDVVDFLTVYIEEAHPSNGWAFEVSTKIPLKLFPFSKRK